MSESKLVYFSLDKAVRLEKWRVKEHSTFTNAQVLFTYEECGSSSFQKFRASDHGFIKKILVKEGSRIKKGSVLLEISPCIHTTVINDMCADCGLDLRLENEKDLKIDASIPMVHAIPELKVSHKIALELGKADTNRLLEDRKLVLLVDLDQTLIHTTNENVPIEQENIHHFQLYGPNSPWYHTKLRPGIANFLSKISLLYELHICTFGARNYAHRIAQILDTDGIYFSQRILSRDECFNINSKTDNLKALFPCGDSMVCIIDDREDVWNMAPNLIQVKPYHYFQHTGDINAPVESNRIEEKRFTGFDEKESTNIGSQTRTQDSGKSCKILNANIETKYLNDAPTKEKVGNQMVLHVVKEDDPDDYLCYLETILESIHTAFYKIYDTSKEISDLKVIIPKLRSQVLCNKTLVFSGLVPNNLKLEQSRAYKVAKSLGATVNQHINEETSHLVAAAAGTFKVNAARKNRNIHIVTPDWLWCCAERWECVSELLYPLDPNRPSKMRQPPPHCHSPERRSIFQQGYEHSDEYNSSEPKFVDTINPLLSFSNADLAEMNEEFDQFFDSNSSSEEDFIINESYPIKDVRKRMHDYERHRSLMRKKRNRLS